MGFTTVLYSKLVLDAAHMGVKLKMYSSMLRHVKSIKAEYSACTIFVVFI